MRILFTGISVISSGLNTLSVGQVLAQTKDGVDSLSKVTQFPLDILVKSINQGQRLTREQKDLLPQVEQGFARFLNLSFDSMTIPKPTLGKS